MNKYSFLSKLIKNNKYFNFDTLHKKKCSIFIMCTLNIYKNKNKNYARNINYKSNHIWSDTMKKLCLSTLVSVCLLTSVAPVATFAAETVAAKPVAQKPNALSSLSASTVVATVGSHKITAGDLDAYINATAPNLNALETGLRRALALRSMVTTQALVVEAEKSPLVKTADYQNQLKNLTSEFLIRSYLAKEVDAKVTPARLKELYKVYVTDASDVVLYHVHHMLLADEAQAKAALAELKKGVKFEEVANKFSLEKDTNPNGDLGFVPKEAIALPELQKALTSLRPGKYTEAPVKSDKGYHLLKLDETRKPTFEEVKPTLEGLLVREETPKVFESLVEKAEKATPAKYSNAQIESAVKDLDKADNK